jgi:hypothetical protein
MADNILIFKPGFRVTDAKAVEMSNTLSTMYKKLDPAQFEAILPELIKLGVVGSVGGAAFMGQDG